MAVRHPTRRNVFDEANNQRSETVRVRFSDEAEFSPATQLGCMLVAIFGGMMLPTDAGMNVKLAEYLGHPLRSACLTFLNPTIGLILINLMFPQWKSPQSFSAAATTSSSAVSVPPNSPSSPDSPNDETAMLSGKGFRNAKVTTEDAETEAINPEISQSEDISDDGNAGETNNDEKTATKQSEDVPRSFDHLNFLEGLLNYFEHLKQSSDKPLEYLTILGGVFGLFYVVMAIYLTPLVGPSVFYISMLLGQLSTSITFDRFGLLWNRTRHLKWLNYGGVLSLFVGVVLFNLDSFGKLSVSLGVFSVSVLLSVLSGISLVVQASLNKRVRHFLGSPFRAAWFSFAVGLSVIAVCALITLGTNPESKPEERKHRWYIWFSGMLGMIYVVISIVVPSVIGFAATFTCVVCGNLSLSLTFDATGAFGFPKESVTALKIVGVFLVICAAVLVNLSPDMLASIQGRCSLVTPSKTASDSRK